MTYRYQGIDDVHIIDTAQFVPIKKLRELANITQLIDFKENVWNIRDKIINILSSGESIVNQTTRFPDDGIYCFLNHPSLRVNFSNMLIAAQDKNIHYDESDSLRKKLVDSLNELNEIVYSLSESNRTANGCYNQKTFESTFKLVWENDSSQL